MIPLLLLALLYSTPALAEGGAFQPPDWLWLVLALGGIGGPAGGIGGAYWLHRRQQGQERQSSGRRSADRADLRSIVLGAEGVGPGLVKRTESLEQRVELLEEGEAGAVAQELRRLAALIEGGSREG